MVESSSCSDRERIIDLKLNNLSKSIKIEIQETLLQAHKHLEIRIDDKIKEAIQSQKEKVSWGVELLRVAIMMIMFVLSLKVMGNL